MLSSPQKKTLRCYSQLPQFQNHNSKKDFYFIQTRIKKEKWKMKKPLIALKSTSKNHSQSLQQHTHTHKILRSNASSFVEAFHKGFFLNSYIDQALNNNFQTLKFYSSKGTTVLSLLWCQITTTMFLPIVLFHSPVGCFHATSLLQSCIFINIYDNTTTNT